MKKKISASTKIYFALLSMLIFCFQTNGQTKDTLIRKLADRTEIYERKSEAVEMIDAINTEKFIFSGESKSELQEFTAKKIEVILKNQNLKQEEIIWSKILRFPKNERAFNYLDIWDVFPKKEKFYVLYFERLDLNVTTVYKNSNDWKSENETFLEYTSESVNPIMEAKFIGKKPKIFAKRLYGDAQEKIYEWKMKKGKWILTKEKVIDVFLNLWKKKRKRK